MNDLTSFLISWFPQGLLFITGDGTVTLCNQAAAKILNKDPTNRKFPECFPDNYFGFSISDALSTKKSPGSFSTKEIEGEATFLNRGLLLQLKNISNEKKKEQLAKQKNQLNELGAMASLIAHEIRNPLGGIKGFAGLLEKDLKDKPAMQKLATHILSGANNMNALVDQVLSYTRPLELKVEKINITPLIEEIQNQFKDRVTFEFPKETIELSADPNLFKTALTELIQNAVEATPPTGKITFKMTVDPQNIIIKLSDTGTHIEKEHLDKIFTPFFKTRTKGPGLFSVSRTIQTHNGTIEVESEEGKETTFMIQLPRNHGD